MTTNLIGKYDKASFMYNENQASITPHENYDIQKMT